MWLKWLCIAVDQLYQLEVGRNPSLGCQTTGHDLLFNITNLRISISVNVEVGRNPSLGCQTTGHDLLFNITNLRISISVNNHRYTRHERAISQYLKPP